MPSKSNIGHSRPTRSIRSSVTRSTVRKTTPTPRVTYRSSRPYRPSVRRTPPSGFVNDDFFTPTTPHYSGVEHNGRPYRRRRHLTMAEILIIVAVVAVLLAVAIGTRSANNTPNYVPPAPSYSYSGSRSSTFPTKPTTHNQRQRLNEDYELTEFVYDDGEFFGDGVSKVEDGLRRIYEVTGVQPVVVTSHQSWTDDDVFDLYCEMFADENRLLICVSPTGAWTYLPGDNAIQVLPNGKTDMLCQMIGLTKDPNVWYDGLLSFAAQWEQ